MERESTLGRLFATESYHERKWALRILRLAKKAFRNKDIEQFKNLILTAVYGNKEKRVPSAFEILDRTYFLASEKENDIYFSYVEKINDLVAQGEYLIGTYANELYDAICAISLHPAKSARLARISQHA